MEDSNNHGSRNRFIKLSLKKNRDKSETDTPDNLNFSFEDLRRVLPKITLSDALPSLNTLNDSVSPRSSTGSSDSVYRPAMSLQNSLHSKTLTKSPRSSKGEENYTQNSIIIINDSTEMEKPSHNGWSPNQNLSCKSKNPTTPSRLNPIARESLEQCSMNKIRRSQIKILDELYGDVWKSIPTLFKKSEKRPENELEIVAKKLDFSDDDSRNDTLGKNGKLEEITNKKVHKTKEEAAERFDGKRKGRIGQKEIDRKIGLVKKIEKVPEKKSETCLKNAETNLEVRKLNFTASLADNLPTWRCDSEALMYKNNFKTHKEKLAAKLYKIFNKTIFDDKLDENLPLSFDSKLRSTAGTTTNRRIRTAGGQIRTSSIKLSTKVIDTSQRLRDTLVHEMCHAATWLIDQEMRAGHGPLWKKWASKSLRIMPELGEISRCHSLEIHFKYSYKCTKCAYTIKRHSKSIDIERKRCGYCYGEFECIVNKKSKSGAVVSTPAKQGETNDFARYVKEYYSVIKDGKKTHGEIMKLLGKQYAAQKTKLSKVESEV